jgi:hypothetical protein
MGLRRGVLSIAVLAGAVFPASAAADTVDTHVTIGYGNIAKVFTHEFSGKVQSPEDACKKDRKVRLYKLQPGPDDLVAKTDSKDNGRWAIGNDIAEGRHYVKVTKALGDGSDVCTRARSKNLKVSQP